MQPPLGNGKYGRMREVAALDAIILIYLLLNYIQDRSPIGSRIYIIIQTYNIYTEIVLLTSAVGEVVHKVLLLFTLLIF